MISQQAQEALVSAISAKIPQISCPMCKHSAFTLITEGYHVNLLQDHLSSIDFEGPILPAIVLTCNNCGFISQHSFPQLGYNFQLPVQEEGNGESNDDSDLKRKAKIKGETIAATLPDGGVAFLCPLFRGCLIT